MARLRVYLDTSVIGALIDEEPVVFRIGSMELFDAVEKGRLFDLHISPLVVEEILNGPDRLIEEFKRLSQRVEMRLLEASEEADELADLYVLAGVVSESDRKDARHLAIASVEGMDVVVSWNFEHMVNASRIRRVHGVNVVHGYGLIQVTTPLGVIYGGD